MQYDSLLEHTAAFYQLQLSRHPEAVHYLRQRGLRDPAVIEELGIGYAPGGKLRAHLSDLGYSLELLLQTGLIGPQAPQNKRTLAGQSTQCNIVSFSSRGLAQPDCASQNRRRAGNPDESWAK